MFLDADELRKLTGYRTPKYQAHWLATRGWVYEMDAAGRPVVAREYAEKKLGITDAKREPKLHL